MIVSIGIGKGNKTIPLCCQHVLLTSVSLQSGSESTRRGLQRSGTRLIAQCTSTHTIRKVCSLAGKCRICNNGVAHRFRTPSTVLLVAARTHTVLTAAHTHTQYSHVLTAAHTHTVSRMSGICHDRMCRCCRTTTSTGKSSVAFSAVMWIRTAVVCSDTPEVTRENRK